MAPTSYRAARSAKRSPCEHDLGEQETGPFQTPDGSGIHDFPNDFRSSPGADAASARSAARIEFFEAGRDESNRMEASLLGGEMDRLFLEWGLADLRGLEIDGELATVGMLVENGPEELVHEVLEIVKAECGLSETERKN